MVSQQDHREAAIAYLSRVRRMEEKLRQLKDEIDCWRTIMENVPAAGFEERVCADRSCNAPYVAAMEKLEDYQLQLQTAKAQYPLLRQEITEAIGTVENPDEQVVLQYHYLGGYSVAQIAWFLSVDERTIRRRHHSALDHFVIPEAPDHPVTMVSQ